MRPPRRKRRRSSSIRLRVSLLSVEWLGWLYVALIALVFGIGWAAERFGGVGWWSSSLPFAACILAMLVGAVASVRIYEPIRRWLTARAEILPALVACLVAFATSHLSTDPLFHSKVQSLRGLVGGPAEAERKTIAHQVYAAYRRADLTQMQRLLERAESYEPIVFEAAKAFDVDPEVLMGIAATESSFLPRDSDDGGRGLFQITAPPKAARARALRRLEVDKLDPRDHRQNAFVAAATLHEYLEEMRGDLFLGLLAYNIGPRNGGLRSILRQYGARDFVTIQPYLQHLPRDYPVRVLVFALAYRVRRFDGTLPRYEEGSNATRIQEIGIPGLHEAPRGAWVLRRPPSPTVTSPAEPAPS